MPEFSSESAPMIELADNIKIPHEHKALDKCLQNINECFDEKFTQLESTLTSDDQKREQYSQFIKFLNISRSK